jgi:L-rhamnose mutarotase
MHKAFLQFCLLITLGLAACNQAEKNDPKSITETKTNAEHVQRFGMVTGLKPEKREYYEQLHAAAWPAVLRKIKECNIQNYSIYLKEIDGKPFLFSYFEYTGTDLEGDMKKMAADSTTQRWWKETDPCQQALPEEAARGKIWAEMKEVFHTD